MFKLIFAIHSKKERKIFLGEKKKQTSLPKQRDNKINFPKLTSLLWIDNHQLIKRLGLKMLYRWIRTLNITVNEKKSSLVTQ